MAGKSNKLKIKKLQINFTDKWFYTFVVVISLIAIGVGVYAAAGTTPDPGHPFTQLQPCDVEGEILKSDGTTWTCGTDEAGAGGGAETDPFWTGNTSNVAFINKANTFDGAITATALVAETIDTGNGAQEVKSIAGYLGDQNLRTTDSPTFGGATIDGVFSLGTPTLLTLDGDNSITVTRSYHKLDTYGSQPTDTLYTINGGEVGMILVLRTYRGTRDVSLHDHLGGSDPGNMYLAGGFTLDSGVDQIVLLRYSENSWTELSRSNNLG